MVIALVTMALRGGGKGLVPGMEARETGVVRQERWGMGLLGVGNGEERRGFGALWSDARNYDGELGGDFGICGSWVNQHRWVEGCEAERPESDAGLVWRGNGNCMSRHTDIFQTVVSFVRSFIRGYHPTLT